MMNLKTPNRMLATALMRTRDSADFAASANARLREHLERTAMHGTPLDTISMQLAASVSEAQARRNANANMCHALGAPSEYLDLALGDDTDAFYELFGALSAN